MTIRELTITVANDAGYIMSEQAPARLKMGVGSAIVEMVILPAGDHNFPREVDFGGEKSPWNIWDQVFIWEGFANGGGVWKSCGNRWGGLKDFGARCGDIITKEATPAT